MIPFHEFKHVTYFVCKLSRNVEMSFATEDCFIKSPHHFEGVSEIPAGFCFSKPVTHGPASKDKQNVRTVMWYRGKQYYLANVKSCLWYCIALVYSPR